MGAKQPPRMRTRKVYYWLRLRPWRFFTWRGLLRADCDMAGRRLVCHGQRGHMSQAGRACVHVLSERERLQ